MRATSAAAERTLGKSHTTSGNASSELCLHADTVGLFISASRRKLHAKREGIFGYLSVTLYYIVPVTGGNKGKKWPNDKTYRNLK